MNTGIHKEIEPAIGVLHSLIIALFFIAIFSAVVAHLVGDKTRQQRKATFNIVTAICILIYVVIILPLVLGAVVGDFPDKPVASAGLALSRYSASAVLLVFILACIMFFKHRPPAGAIEDDETDP